MASLIVEDRPRRPYRVDWLDRRRRRTRRFATRREAERFIGDLARSSRQASAPRLTLDKWIVRWLQDYGPEWTARTRRDRADYLDRLILPELGALRLHEISRADVRQWRAGLVRHGVTHHVANRAVSILSAALGDAVSDEILPANPCAGLEKLPEDSDPRQPATLFEVESIRQLLDHLYDPRGILRPRANPNLARDRAIVGLLTYAGVRPSELGRVSWQGSHPTAIVIRSAKGGPKRTVPVIDALAEDLDGAGRAGPELLERLDRANWGGRTWRPTRNLIGSEVTPYSCRHTFASLLIAEGRSVHEVARLLGHSTPRLTLDTYGHLFDEAQLRPDESMADAVVRARQEAEARHWAVASISRTI